MSTRLNKQLVELGLVSSRRKADELITQGAVSVNGTVTTKLATQIGAEDVITLYGRSGQKREHVYLAFNKPVGYVCTHRTQTDRQKTIFDLLPLSFAGLKIAGRLDKESQGLMVLSSDGAFIQAISHPSQGKLKTYMVFVDKPVQQSDQAKLLEGIKLYDGVSKFESVSRIKPQLLRVTLSEGRNRQIRRTFEALGYKVKMLERTRIGRLDLGVLKSGAHRFIKPSEIVDA